MPEGIRWTSRPGQPVRVQWAALAHGFCWSARYRGFVFCVCAAFCRECVGGRRRRRKETPKFSLGLIFFLSLSLPSLICRRKNSVRQSNKQLAIISRKGKKTVRLDFFGILVPPHPNQVRRAVPALCFFFPSFYFRFPLFSPLISVTSSGVLCCVIACLCRTRWSAEIQEREKKRERVWVFSLPHHWTWPYYSLTAISLDFPFFFKFIFQFFIFTGALISLSPSSKVVGLIDAW